MDNADVFLEDMRSLRPDVADYFEALVFALETARRYSDECGVRYFGQVGDGTFYAENDFDSCRWFPETTPMEALGCLAAEFGEDRTEGLESFSLEPVDED